MTSPGAILCRRLSQFALGFGERLVRLHRNPCKLLCSRGLLEFYPWKV